MPADLASRDAPRQQFPGSHAVRQTGSIILAGGSPTGLIAVPGGLFAELGAEAARVRGVVQNGGEVGGLLIGPKPDHNDVLIEEVAPFGVEYRFSPTLLLSFTAFDSVKAAIAATEQDEAKAILGLYRITGASDGSLLQADFEMLNAIRQSHPRLSSIRSCFVIDAAGTELPMRILIDNGSGWEEIYQIMLSVQPEHGRTTPRAHTVPAGALSKLRNDQGSSATVVARQTLEPSVTSARVAVVTGRMRIAAVITAIALLLAGAAGAYRWTSLRRSSANETRQESPLAVRTGFSATPEGSSWKLTWSSAAVMAMNPTSARLVIQDGIVEQDVPLTMADLSTGTIYYSPKNGALAFHLQVLRNGVSLAENRVRVLDRPDAVGKNPQQARPTNVGSFSSLGSEKTLVARVQPSSGSANGTVAELLPGDAAPAPPGGPSRNQQPARGDMPPKQVSTPSREGKLIIPTKPAALRPSEAFQFKVIGNPAPEVAWSSEGPGSIDPVYGVYRAPTQFASEATVKIIAKSWKGAQSVTFLLKGGSNDPAKEGGEHPTGSANKSPQQR